MNKNHFLYIAFCLTLNLFAQQKTMNPEFDNMLKTLLNHSVQEVAPKEIKDDKNIVYLDAREKREYKVSHIKEAIWTGYDTFNMSRIKDIPKNQKIVVYCSVGYRSEKIAEKLICAGYTDVSNLYGGIFEWVHQNKKVVNKKGTTQEVHAYDKEWGQWLKKGIKKF